MKILEERGCNILKKKGVGVLFNIYRGILDNAERRFVTQIN